MKRLVVWFSLLLPALILILAAGLRLYKLDSLPPSLYWEEVALGYDAYSILKTGRDFHGAPLPIVAFESFGDWKPSLYFYTVVPAIAILGLNEWAVRIPSALAGLAIVIAVGLLARKIGGDIKPFNRLIIGMSVAAISPWAILFSRGGWESNVATALIAIGVTAFVYFIDVSRDQTAHFSNRRERLAISLFSISVGSLCLSMYAYHAARFIAPMLGIGLLGLWWSQTPTKFLKRQARFILIGATITLVIGMPLLLSLRSIEAQQRFNETNIFADLSLVKKSNQLQADAGNTWLATLLYHRYVMYIQAMIESYLSHFSANFLFIQGDQNPRHSIQFMGQLYHIEIILVGLGIWWFIRRRRPLHLFLAWWLLIGIIPASITHATPHALRILPTLPVWLLIITAGIMAANELLSEFWSARQAKPTWLMRLPVNHLFFIGLIGVYTLELLFFWRFYTKIYPQAHGDAFNDGYKQMILAIDARSKKEPDMPVAIMRSQGRPSAYYWFYTQTDPQRVQVLDAHVRKDQGEYLAFENVSFPNSIDEIPSPALLAITVENYPNLVGQPLDVHNPNLEITTDRYNRPKWVILRY